MLIKSNKISNKYKNDDYELQITQYNIINIQNLIIYQSYYNNIVFKNS